MTDQPTQEAIENAHARVHHWNGIALEPFSFEREAAYDRLRLRGESLVESCAAIVYLCTLGEELIDKTTTGMDLIDGIRGEEAIRNFRRRIANWANEQGVTGNNSAGDEIVKLGTAIWEETKVSRFQPIAKGGTSGPNA